MCALRFGVPPERIRIPSLRALYAVIPSVSGSGLSEFEALYQSGLMDRYEYEQRKDKLSTMLDKFLGRDQNEPEVRCDFTAPDIQIKGFLDQKTDNTDH